LDRPTLHYALLKVRSKAISTRRWLELYCFWQGLIDITDSNSIQLQAYVSIISHLATNFQDPCSKPGRATAAILAPVGNWCITVRRQNASVVY